MEAAVPPSIGFDKLLVQLHEQHQALRRENQKLRDELKEMKASGRLGRKKAPPPVPPMPPKLIVASSGLVPIVQRARSAPAPALRDAALQVESFEEHRASFEEPRAPIPEPEKPAGPKRIVSFSVPGSVVTEPDTQPPKLMDSASAVRVSGASGVSGGSGKPRKSVSSKGFLSDRAAKETVVETLSNTDIVTKRKRLERIFGAKEDFQKPVTPTCLLTALDEKADDHNLTVDMCAQVIAVLKGVLDGENSFAPGAPKVAKLIRSASNGFFGGNVEISVPFEDFADLILSPDLLDRVGNDGRFALVTTINTLCTTTVDELIQEATKGDFDGATLYEKETQQPKILQITNAVVSVFVIGNMVALGISVDRSPDHYGWLLLETLCCMVWVAEMTIKLCHMGCYEYFRGETGWWNISDLMITTISIGELLISVGVTMADAFGYGSKLATSSRVIVMLRILRVARVVRLLKLLNTPVLQDFANAVSGFVIGMPSLIWVLVFFLIILCMVGLTFRITLGPSPGQDLTTPCGMADDIADLDDPLCPVHWVYGEEFFGTVPISMFTSFRFMLGDYSSRGGKSVVVALSQGYGSRFQTIFVIWMIGVIFGFFNIVTAIFVETTVAGLKYNDVKKKYHRQYERRYVQGKLKDFVDRFSTLARQFRPADMLNEVNFDEEEFVQIVKDEQITALLEDLDIEAFNPAGMFYTFDGDGNGRLTLEELTQGIMKARGKPQKTDILASWVSTRALHDKFDELRTAFEESQGSGQAGLPLGGFPRPTSPNLARTL